MRISLNADATTSGLSAATTRKAHGVYSTPTSLSRAACRGILPRHCQARCSNRAHGSTNRQHHELAYAADGPDGVSWHAVPMVV